MTTYWFLNITRADFRPRQGKDKMSLGKVLLVGLKKILKGKEKREREKKKREEKKANLSNQKARDLLHKDGDT